MRAARLVTVTIAALALAQTTRSVWDGVYTEDQAKRGAAVYAKECASCHGAELGGGESAPALVGGTFLMIWGILALSDRLDRQANYPGSHSSAYGYTDAVKFIKPIFLCVGGACAVFGIVIPILIHWA